MRPVILYRKGMDFEADEVEIAAAKDAGFLVIYQRTDVMEGNLVIGRFSVLPFYKELYLDVYKCGGRLINAYSNHVFIADMAAWCHVLGDLTPKLYARMQDMPETGRFVVKGQTNSKKFLWSTHMYAESRAQAVEIFCKLKEDALFESQAVYARDYVPLVKLGDGLNGLPISKEFRFFVVGDEIICGAFYWSSHVGDIESVPDVSEVPTSFLNEAIGRIGHRASAYALDVAQTEAGDWIVIELNDLQMSGLSCNEPKAFYEGLYKACLRLEKGRHEN